MLEKILQWAGTVFAIIGVVFLFIEAIGSIRRRNNTKLSILGLVFLSISLVGYLLTEVILRAKGLPVIFSCLWLLFMWAYLICNLVSTIKLSKQVRKEKLAKQQADQAAAANAEQVSAPEQQQNADTSAAAASADNSAEVCQDGDTSAADAEQAEEQPTKRKSAKKKKEK